MTDGHLSGPASQARQPHVSPSSRAHCRDGLPLARFQPLPVLPPCAQSQLEEGNAALLAEAAPVLELLAADALSAQPAQVRSGKACSSGTGASMSIWIGFVPPS